MEFLAISNKGSELNYLEKVLHEAVPDCSLICFTKLDRALEYMADSSTDAVFLETAQNITDSFFVAKQFKEIQPDVHIIFISGLEQKTSGSVELFLIGYLQKPVTIDNVQRELRFLDHCQSNITKKKETSDLSVSKEYKKFNIFCFGEFSIYYNQTPVHLSCKKAYELIAYLIVHHGHPVSKWEIASRLWENSADSRAKDSLYKVLKKIKKIEEDIGCSFIGSSGQKIFLEKDRIQCTLWEFEALYQNKNFPNYKMAQRLFKEMLFGGEAYSWILEEEGRYELMYLEIVEYLLSYYQKKKAHRKVVYYQNILNMADM